MYIYIFGRYATILGFGIQCSNILNNVRMNISILRFVLHGLGLVGEYPPGGVVYFPWIQVGIVNLIYTTHTYEIRYSTIVGNSPVTAMFIYVHH